MSRAAARETRATARFKVLPVAWLAPSRAQRRTREAAVGDARVDAAAVTLSVALLATFAALMWLTRRQWFFLDEWAMLTHFDASHHAVGAFTPWNQHWVTAVFLYYQLMYHLVGLHAYAPYMAVLIGVHVAIVAGVWRLMVGIGVDRWVAVGAALLFAFFGGGWENVVWAFQIGYIAPLLLGLVALQAACVSQRTRTCDAVYVVALTAGLAFSAIGLVMLFCGLVAVALRRGMKQAAALNAVPVAVYATWYLLVGRTAIGVTGSVAAIPADILRGLIGSLGAIFGAPALGGVLLVGLAWFTLRHRSEIRGRLAVPAAMALAALFFGALTALGRGGTMETSLVPRYFYVDVLLLLPLLGVAATSLIQGVGVRRLVVVTAFVMAAAIGWGTLVSVADAYAPLNTETHQYVVAAAILDATRPNDVLLPDDASIENHFFPFIHRSSLARFAHDGVLSDDVRISDSIASLVELRLQTSMTPRPLFTQPPSSTSGALSTCTSVSAGENVSVALSRAGSLLVAGDDARSVVSVVLVDQRSSVHTPPVALGAIGQSAQFVNSTLTGVTLQISGSAGTTRVCPASHS